ncbi:MAG: Uncharacterised protein [Owenweeksia sp. TMED14]|nr:MAG: Uncharacterised protein [Owenweeksia sp. TMED14]
MKKYFFYLLFSIPVLALAQTGNTEYGTDALNTSNAGDYNSAFGNSFLHANTLGSYNTAIGYKSLYTNTSGAYNTATVLGLWYRVSYAEDAVKQEL